MPCVRIGRAYSVRRNRALRRRYVLRRLRAMRYKRYRAVPFRRSRLYIRRSRRVRNRRPYRRYNRIIGRGIKYFTSLAPVIRYKWNIVSPMQNTFRYGAEAYDETYQQFDVLALHLTKFQTAWLQLLQKQYINYLINKVVVTLRDFNIEYRIQNDRRKEFVWGNDVKAPFTNGNFYEYNPNAYSNGMYVKVFPSKDDTETAEKLVTERNIKMRYNRNRRGYYRKTLYPACHNTKNSSDAILAKTLGQQIADMGPSRYNWLRYNIGWGPLPVRIKIKAMKLT